MEVRTWIAALILLVLPLVLPLAAQGQAEQPESPPWPSTFTIAGQGGVQIFPGGASKEVGTGIAYGVLFVWKPFWIGGLELGYQGTNYKTKGDVGGPQSSVFENGAELLLRLSPRVGLIEPYLLAGGGFSRVTVQNDVGVVRKLRDSTVAKVPLGVGLDVHLQRPAAPITDVHAVVGVRGLYQFVFSNDFLETSGRGADQIAITALVGVNF